MNDDWQAVREELLQDAETRAALEERRPRFELARQMIALRVALGLSQQELAERTGMSQPVISRLESGDLAPRWDTISRLLAAMSATVEVKAKDRHGKQVRVRLNPADWSDPHRAERRHAG